MRTFKPLLLGATLAAGFVWAGAAAAVQPADSISQTSPADSTAAAQPMVTFVRKVYFFPQLDINHNGRLSRAEIPTDMHDLRIHFMEADFDENGQLSPEEYVMYAQHTAPMYVGVAHARIWLSDTSGTQRVIRLP